MAVRYNTKFYTASNGIFFIISATDTVNSATHKSKQFTVQEALQNFFVTVASDLQV